MTYDLQVVPPPNNESWAETFIWQALCRIIDPFVEIAPPAEHRGAHLYNASALSRLEAQVANHLTLISEHGPIQYPGQLLHTEAYTFVPTFLRSVMQFHTNDRPWQAALVHGGSFIPGDTMPSELEEQYLEQYNVTIAPTQWAADRQEEKYPSTLVQAARWPLAPDVHQLQRGWMPARIVRQTVINFPHRLIEQKGWPTFNRYFLADPIDKNLNAYVPRRDQASREQYLAGLRDSQVIFADSEWETFGMAVAEGIALGCCPMLNEHPVYKELWGGNNVHWHDGSEESIREAYAATRVCDEDHSRGTSELDSMYHVLRIASIASGERTEGYVWSVRSDDGGSGGGGHLTVAPVGGGDPTAGE